MKGKVEIQQGVVMGKNLMKATQRAYKVVIETK